MRAKFKIVILLMAVLMVVALWRITDVARGESGSEDLILYVPILLASLVSVAALTLALRRRPGTQVAAPPWPGTSAQGNWRRIEKGITATVTLLIILYTAVWAIRAGDVWMPLLIGGITLVVSWILMVIIWRILRSKAQRQESPTR
jgi:hypothetical protein